MSSLTLLFHAFLFIILTIRYAESTKNDFLFIGCFQNDHDRVLSNKITGYFKTNNECNSVCSASGFLFFVRRNWGECYCGSFHHDKFGQLDESDCKCENEYVGSGIHCVYERKLNKGKNGEPQGIRRLKQAKGDKVEKENKSSKAKKDKAGGKSNKKDKFTYDAIVVGAGWSGLAASKSLISHGIKNIKVIEASDIIGGRCKTATLSDGTAINLGPMWIHGAGVPGALNPIYEVLLDTQVDYGIDQNNFTTYMPYGNGTKLDESIILTVNYFVELFFLSMYYYDPNITMREAVDIFIDANGSSMSDAEQDYFLEIIRVYAFSASAPIELLTVQYFLALEAFGGPEIIVSNYGALVQHYASSIPEDTFLMKSAVTKVNYEGDIVELEYVTDKGKRKTIRTKKVILTVSLGVLKADVIAFKPQLPSWKANAIENMGWGYLDLCEFAWNEGTQLPWKTGSDLQALSILLMNTPGVRNEEKWYFFTYPVSTNNGVRQLCRGYVLGRNPNVFSDKEKYDTEFSSDMLKELKKIFGDGNVPAPDDVIVTRWTNDPLTRGAYSFTQPDESMAAPVDEKVYFAGEATHIQFHQTVHGAFLSGLDVAEKVVKKLES